MSTPETGFSHATYVEIIDGVIRLRNFLKKENNLNSYNSRE
jgi:hypothetical protein